MSWAQIAQYPVALPFDSFYASDNELYAAETGGKIYTFASPGISSQAPASDIPYQFYEYNPSTNVWTAKAVPGAEGTDINGQNGKVSGAYLVAGGGHVYRVGGDWQSDVMVYTEANFYDYTISANTWASKAKPIASGVPSNILGAAYAGGKVWVLSGGQLSSFNPAAGTWSANVSATPVGPVTGSDQSPIVGIGNYIYLIGTSSKTVNGNSVTIWPLYRFDTTNNTWTQLMENTMVYPSGVLESGTLLPTFPGGSTSSSSFDGIVAQSTDILSLFTPVKSTYSTGPVGVSLSRLRPQIGDDVKYTFSQYLTAAGLTFYESAASGNRQYYGLVGYNGSIYTICPRSKSTSSYGYEADQRSFKYTPDALTTPTSPTPASGSTVTTDVPTLGGTLAGTQDKKGIEWEIASDTAFTVNKKNIFDYKYVPPAYYGSGRYDVDDPTAAGGTFTSDIVAGSHAELNQGTWYMRARSYSGPDVSAWTATATLTVSHPPAAAPTSPINDTTLDFGASGAVTLQWNFTDTSSTDVQTGYQIIVERNSDGTVLLDTGKMLSQTARSYAWTLPAAEKDNVIRWKIRAWDSDDVAGAYSNYALFRMSDVPTVSITDPAEGGQVTTGKPTTTWTFTASAGRTQASYRVRFYWNGTTVVHDSGTVSGTETSYTPADQILDVGSYMVRVDVTDNRGLSNYDTNNFTTSYDAPNSPEFSVNSLPYPESGYVEVTWNAANQDYAFSNYNIWRREQGQGDDAWVKVGEDYNVQGDYSFRDYAAASGVTYEYVVTQVAYRFSVLAESTKAVPGPQPGGGRSEQYWLVHPTDPSLSVLLRNVNSEDFADEQESEELLLIGRGRHMDYGTRWGYKGTLSAQIRNLPDGTTGRELRLRLELLKASGETVYLRNPFGDIWYVALADIAFKRVAGVGTQEFLDVTIPYSEVV